MDPLLARLRAGQARRRVHATEARLRNRARSDDYDPHGRPTVYGGASKLDLVPEADLGATAGVPLEELEGVPTGSRSSSVDATPASSDD